jgi:hypothetical protein
MAGTERNEVWAGGAYLARAVTAALDGMFGQGDG